MRFPLINSSMWLHADLKHVHNRIHNYLYHGHVNLTERADIHWRWNKIKDSMDGVLKEMDDVINQKQLQNPHKSAKNQLM